VILVLHFTLTKHIDLQENENDIGQTTSCFLAVEVAFADEATQKHAGVRLGLLDC